MKKACLPFSILFLTACSQEELKDSPLYEGTPLDILVIGHIPDVREQTVTFASTTLEQVAEKTSSGQQRYDVLFITKEHFEEASDDRYIEMYEQSSIPVIFIESKKSFLPFTTESLHYSNAHEVNDGMYMTWIVPSKSGSESFGIGLYNDEENKANIADAYSRLFEKLQAINNQAPLETK